ncbi:biotin carboxylase [Acidilutibacter cellobiosedens]|uniref:Biotin carboxylase n=1 Tax=Acidilutibacter cellobiosedens TaxID=2507161 RepID=A0A410QD07_9FIRM|nr:BREX system ATP-binding domain-containing protein [Acidilutibacter cellobiosedens]MBE6083144.1 biotin carboxylase [Tissierellaceae bacterium]QAT61932.1 biotin carboxylase [Acidilutibacter cellobiosedens]
MKQRVNPKEADNIIKALEGGIVPRRGIQHLLVGRNEEVQEIISILDSIIEGGSDIRFWVGDFGSGKSFMLRTIESIAVQKNFVVSTVDLTPTRRFYASDGKAKALYSEIVDNIIIQTFQDGNAINTILEEWINRIIMDISKKNNIPVNQLFMMENKDIVENEILNITSSFNSVGLSYELGQAIAKYYEGIVKDKRALRLKALRWIRGDMDTKTESKRELGIERIINDDNWYDAVKNLAELFLGIGYSGFVVNFDEVVNLYKLPLNRTRERNYERILNIFNECKSNTARGLFVNLGATRKSVFDENRGMASYGALKGRLGTEDSMDFKLLNTNRTVLPLRPLSVEEIYTLLENLNNIYNVHYKEEISMTTENIKMYMEEQLNRPGAVEFLTPRAVIKDYLEILDLIRQNPDEKTENIIYEKFGKKSMPVTKDEANKDDEIEVL